MKINLRLKDIFSHSQEKENATKARVYTPRSKENVFKQLPFPLTPAHKRTKSYLSPKASVLQ